MAHLKLRVFRDFIRRFNNYPVAVAVILILVCVFRLPARDVRMSFILLFEYGAMLALSLWIWRENKWLSMFLILCLYSSLWPHYDKYTFLTLHDIFLGVIWYMIIVRAMNGKEDILLDAICIVALANVVFLIMQTCGFDPIFKPIDPKLSAVNVGLQGNKNETAAMLAFCFPAFLREKWWKVAPLVVLGQFLAATSLGMIAMAAGGLFFATIKGYWKIGLMVTVGVVGAFLLLADTPTYSHRMNVLTQGWDLFLQRPFRGGGIGHWQLFSQRLLQTPDGWYKYAHCEFLQALFEMGALFGVILIGYAVNIFRRYNRHAALSLAAVVTIAINSMGHFGFHIATTALVAVTWMAILEIKLRERKSL